MCFWLQFPTLFTVFPADLNADVTSVIVLIKIQKTELSGTKAPARGISTKEIQQILDLYKSTTVQLKNNS